MAAMSRLRLRQRCEKVSKVRAFYVSLMCFLVCSQLEGSIVIQMSLGRAADYKCASYASRRREAGVCKEGQGGHRWERKPA